MNKHPYKTINADLVEDVHQVGQRHMAVAFELKPKIIVVVLKESDDLFLIN
jgi:hypothetical protein